MNQEQIIDVLNEAQTEFKGINEANIHSADILIYMFEKQKLEFAIEQLNKLDSILKTKVEKLNEMLDSSEDSDNKEYFRIKISGLKLSKEEIRRDVKELKQKLSDLNQ